MKRQSIILPILILAFFVLGCERYKAIDSEKADTLVYDKWKGKIYRVTESGLELLTVKGAIQPKASIYRDLGSRKIPPPHNLYVALEITRIQDRLLYRVKVSPKKILSKEELSEEAKKFLEKLESEPTTSESQEPTPLETTKKQDEKKVKEIPKDWFKAVTSNKKTYASISCILNDVNGFKLKTLEIAANTFQRVIDDDGEVSYVMYEGEVELSDDILDLTSGFRLSWYL